MATRNPTATTAKKPELPKQAALVVQPSKVLTRSVVRRIAHCPLDMQDSEGNMIECAFNGREKPTLHTTPASAEVEAGRHIREAHAEELSIDVQAKVRRVIASETVDLSDNSDQNGA